MAFHIPMTERYIAVLHGTTAALLASALRQVIDASVVK
jgi:hypothetical protein